jgi:hypothetical protein
MGIGKLRIDGLRLKGLAHRWKAERRRIESQRSPPKPQQGPAPIAGRKGKP